MYKVVPATKTASNGAVTVTRLAAAAKQSRRPFGGSEVSFELLPEGLPDTAESWHQHAQGDHAPAQISKQAQMLMLAVCHLLACLAAASARAS